MKKTIGIVIGGCLGLGICYDAGAGAYLDNGLARIGVDTLGELNVGDGSVPLPANASSLGLSYFFDRPGYGPSYQDATAPGCWCEGWGVSAFDGSSSFSGFANKSLGTGGLSSISFTSDPTFIKSVVDVGPGTGLEVTQLYTPVAGVLGLFQDDVTVKNASGGTTFSDIRYVRVMDWDVPPTEFWEYVTIKGTATTTLLERSHDNGFNTADPLGGDGSLDASTEDVDFTDNGQADHGAYFRFKFPTVLAPGESLSFKVYYGAAANEASMLAKLALVGIELYSLGQNGNPTHNDEVTYAFGFKGVGGTAVLPETGQTVAMLGMGLLSLFGMARWRKS